jgi:hypothetical protein
MGVKPGRSHWLRVLRRIFKPKRDEVIGEWRKLYGELNDLYCSIWVIKLSLR